MKTINIQSRKRQAGFSLLEALLAAAIATAMLGALVVLLADSQSELRAKNMAEQMQAFQRVAAQYYTANRARILDAMGDDNGHEAENYCRVDMDPDGEGGRPAFDLELHTCTVDVSLLRARHLLPQGFSERTLHGEKLIAVFRRLYEEPDSENPQLSENVEMLVLAVLPEGVQPLLNGKRYVESLSVAGYMGATGGVLPDGDRGKCRVAPDEGLYEICGNGWKLKLDEFLSEAQVQAFGSMVQR